MIESAVISNRQEWESWVSDRKAHDFRFDAERFTLPVFVVWVDTEANGRPDVHWAKFYSLEMALLSENLIDAAGG